MAPPVPLVGDGLAVPCVDGNDRPYLSLDAAASTGRAAGGAGPGGGVPALVLERAPRRRLQVPAGHRRLRGGPRGRPGLRRPRSRGTDDVAIICRNTTEAINHLAYRLRLNRDDVVVTTVVEHHANLLPWARAATAATSSAGRTARSASATSSPRSTAARAAAAGRHRGVQHHRLDAAARRDHRRPPTTAASRCWSTPPSSPRTGRCPPAPTTWPGAATRCTPRSAPGCSSGPGTPSPTATRSWPAAAPSTWSTSTRWSGPTRPSGRRPAPPTSSAPSPCTPPSTSSTGIGWAAIIEPRRAIWPGGCATGLAGDRRRPAARARTSATETLPVATFTVDGVPHALVAARLGRRVRHRRAPRLLLRPSRT